VQPMMVNCGDDDGSTGGEESRDNPRIVARAAIGGGRLG
jgi:hypothetical protein